MDLPTIAMYASLGFAGGLLHTALRSGGVLVLPQVKEGKLYLGCLLSGLIGLVSAVAVDNSWLTAFFAAVAIPDVAEGAVRSGQARLSGRRRK
ncbi:MAG: hypothetical protein HZB92_08320 [Euryarchaeota archaeon]|nr:hypothetical protein [Euryarchaeota archaeon]